MNNSETSVNVNMSSELRDKIEEASQREGIGKSAFIRNILIEYFKGDDGAETQYSSMSVDLDRRDKRWLRKLLKI